jgi:hypothetical protein
MDTQHSFRLRFTTNRSETLTLNVPRANHSATPAQITAAMDSIVASNAVQFARGEPVSMYSADLITVQRRDFAV